MAADEQPAEAVGPEPARLTFSDFTRIEGLSDKRRLPRRGKLHLGIIQKSPRTGNPYPTQVDFFVCKPDESTPEDAATAFREVYGDKPRVLDIMFPVESAETFFPQAYRRYSASSGLVCIGNGRVALMQEETGPPGGAPPGRAPGFIEIECVGEDCPYVGQKQCRHVGTLQFFLPKVRGLGVWQIDTGSTNSIIGINSGIDMIRGLTGGRIAMLPLHLTVGPRQVKAEGKKKLVYVMSLSSQTVYLEQIIQAARSATPVFLLPPVDMKEQPKDIIPDGVLNGGVDTAAPVSAASPPAAREPDELDHQIEDGFKALGVPPAKQNLMRTQYGDDRAGLLKALNCMADGGTEAPAPPTVPVLPPRPPLMPEPDELDRKIDEGFKVLGTPAARRRLLREKCGKDREGLFAAINREIDKRADSLGPGPRAQSRPANGPGKPTQPPVAPSPAKPAAPKPTQPAGPVGPLF